MKIITKRDRILGVLDSYKKQYGSTGLFKENLNALSLLDLNTATEQQIINIVGNPTWTELICDSCKKNKDIVMEFLEENEHQYESNACFICKDCLGLALNQINFKENREEIKQETEIQLCATCGLIRKSCQCDVFNETDLKWNRKEDINNEETKIAVHEFWMSFRRRYHKVKEGHLPGLTHQEVEALILELWRYLP